MKILLFTLEYPPFKGGIANYNENVVKFWPDKNISVLHNNSGELISEKSPIKWLPAISALWRTIKKEGVDHVLVAQILPLGTAAYIVSRLTKVRYSVFIHGTDLNKALTRARKKILAKKILKGARYIICNSNYVAGLVKNFIGQNDKIKVVQPGIRADGMAENQQSVAGIKNKYGLKGKVVLLSVGRLVKRKGVDTVLVMLPEALKQIPNLFYAIVGHGEELADLQTKIKELGLEKQAIIITDADDAVRNAWLYASDIYISASREVAGDVEGFGIALLEANLAGKPVIAGRSGGVAEAVADGETGLLVDATDKTAIINAIVKLAGDEALRRRLGGQGRERAIKNFDWQKQVEKIYQIINL